MQQVEKICLSETRGAKKERESCNFIKDYGIEGDFHGGRSEDRQVSFLPQAVLADFKKELERAGRPIAPGAFGENIIFSGFGIEDISKGDIIELGDSVKVEVRVIGKDCPHPCDIYKTMGRCIMPQYGIFGRVISGGRVKVGDSINYRK